MRLPYPFPDFGKGGRLNSQPFEFLILSWDSQAKDRKLHRVHGPASPPFENRKRWGSRCFFQFSTKANFKTGDKGWPAFLIARVSSASPLLTNALRRLIDEYVPSLFHPFQVVVRFVHHEGKARLSPQLAP